ncbi:MAG: hypothetical protein AVDCRST_MAG93-1293 [uncultured Chloroflexia bacterium]|uniref:Uncharacterized protein n=1 Tax=uncultured Chloroflexia bacterium TaxID=1672391 RepID=A0A6J4I4H1_9CHLR|nr:MAG: hypothetical protein AVDCRST_MAG93-1293 [uncultured Chloroflexia bacterium]
MILDHIIAAEGVGLSMLRQLQQRLSRSQIPVIVYTAATKTVEQMEDELLARACVARPGRSPSRMCWLPSSRH